MKIRIYQAAKNAMQSAKSKNKIWKIAFIQQSSNFIDPLMGWVGTKDTNQQLKIGFDSKESAIKYAQKHNYDYEIIDEKQRNIVPKSYAANFQQ